MAAKAVNDPCKPTTSIKISVTTCRVIVEAYFTQAGNSKWAPRDGYCVAVRMRGSVPILSASETPQLVVLH
jgi:hypothetical protein